MRVPPHRCRLYPLHGGCEMPEFPGQFACFVFADVEVWLFFAVLLFLLDYKIYVFVKTSAYT